MLWLICVSVLIVYITITVYNNVYYWDNRGVKQVKPWPLLGNFGKAMFKRISMVDQLQTWYYKYPQDEFIGLHQLNVPLLMIRDPNIIKQVTVKHFDNFTDHTVVITEDMDPLFGKNLVSLKGQQWKNMRSTLSPAFTSSKMKKMYTLIKDCSKQFTDHFLQKDQDLLELEMKDIFTKFTNDVIATSAFGITCNSLEDDKNEFYALGNKITNLGSSFKFVGYFLIPKLMKALNITLFDKHVTNFFRKIIKTTIEVREKHNIIRPDMIHLLMEARKGKLKHELETDEDAGFATVEESQSMGKVDKPILTEDDITSQALLFFLAGYDTSSTMMSFLSHELAVNPHVQKKLQDEIDETLERCDGDIDYDSLLKMNYLDMVICESLRKWPPAPITERICTRSCTLETETGTFTVDKNQTIWMPIFCLQHDDKYFEEPENFKPERFSDENKLNIPPFTYLPFGAGPRNCIGSRFALLEIKSLMTHILAKFDIVVIDKTDIPLKLSKQINSMKPEKGFWLGFKRRD